MCTREGAAKCCSDSGVTGEAFLLRLHHSFVLPVIVSAFITYTAPSRRRLPCGLAVSLSLCLPIHWLSEQTQSLTLRTPHLLKGHRSTPISSGSLGSILSRLDCLGLRTAGLHDAERQPAQRIQQRKRCHTAGGVVEHSSCIAGFLRTAGLSVTTSSIYLSPTSPSTSCFQAPLSLPELPLLTTLCRSLFSFLFISFLLSAALLLSPPPLPSCLSSSPLS